MTTLGGKLISQMKLVSVLNMSPSGMRLHFYSLTLHELKLISWKCRFAEAPAAGCRLSTIPAQKTFPSSHLIWGLDLIKDLSWTTSATAMQSRFFNRVFLLNLHKADGISTRDYSDFSIFMLTTRMCDNSNRVLESFFDWCNVAFLNRSTLKKNP